MASALLRFLEILLTEDEDPGLRPKQKKSTRFERYS
jgi:hypothetical protein